MKEEHDCACVSAHVGDNQSSVRVFLAFGICAFGFFFFRAFVVLRAENNRLIELLYLCFLACTQLVCRCRNSTFYLLCLCACTVCLY